MVVKMKITLQDELSLLIVPKTAVLVVCQITFVQSTTTTKSYLQTSEK